MSYLPTDPSTVAAARRVLAAFLTLVMTAAVVLVAAPLARASHGGTHFAVNSTVDAVDAAPGDGACATAAGECTLRAAIQETNALPGADVIEVPASDDPSTTAVEVYGLTVDDDLEITDEARLVGAGAATTVIDASGITDRVIQVKPAWVDPNGSDPQKLVTIEKVTVSGGRAFSEGGGILHSEGDLHLVDAVVAGNEAPYGGGIRSMSVGDLTLVRTTVADNVAHYEGGGIWFGDDPTNSLTLTDSTVRGNHALDPEQDNSSEGGGIWGDADLVMTNSVVTNNRANGGAGIFNDGTGNRITITDSRITGNVAVDPDPDEEERFNPAAGYYGFGGGIANMAGQMHIVLVNTEVSGNHAWHGGGIYTEGYDDVEHIGGVTLTLDAGTVVGTTDGTAPNTAFIGGGILAYGPDSNDDILTVRIEDDSAVSGNSASRSGGGIWARHGVFVDVWKSAIDANTAAGSGGGLYHDGWPREAQDGEFKLSRSSLSRNEAGGGNGGGASLDNVKFNTFDARIEDNTAGDDGGGLYWYELHGGNLSRTTIAGNTAAGDGGGIYSDGCWFPPGKQICHVLRNSTVSGNHAGGDGGGVHIEYNYIFVYDATIAHNSAGDDGGGVNDDTDETSVIIRNSIIAANTAADRGDNCGATVSSQGHNLQDGGVNECGLSGTGDLTVGDAGLEPLANYDGVDAPYTNYTHALADGSPAIDAGSSNNCPSEDQRRVPRPFDGDGDGDAGCDIGAYEVSDRDGDGLRDEERVLYGTDPANPDTDGDGISDGDEVAAHSDPLDACDPHATGPDCDADGDGVRNADDACQDTPAGTTVDASGCQVASGTEPHPTPTTSPAPVERSTSTTTTVPGQRVSTLPPGGSVSEERPLATGVVAPVPGEVSITQREASFDQDPAGVVRLNLAVDITAPPADSPEDPLVLDFTFHPSAVPDGVDADNLVVERNGVTVDRCTGPAGVASPDPCATVDTDDAGNLVVAVFTTRASTWTFAGRLEAPSPCPDGQVPSAGFGDVAAGSTHAAAVDCVVWWGLANGFDADTFGPRLTVTRAQMAAFVARLVRAAGGDLPDGRHRFVDVAAGSTHAGDINALAAAGVVNGTGAVAFEPQAPVSRGQMASLLVRAYGYVTGQQPQASRDWFVDDNGSVHEAAINVARDLRFTSGVTDTTFAPRAAVRRDQMASFLANTLERLAADGQLAGR